jgi:DNA repair protein RadC
MTKLAMTQSESAPAKVLTTQLKHALEMFDIRVVNHIIAGETAYSFAGCGLL